MMVRTALRSTTARPSPRVETAVELLDRTGIVAASLPQRRRTEFESDDELPESEHTVVPEPQPKDMDLRPRAVVIHRRAKAWIGAAAGVTLLAIGWLVGGSLTNQGSETASPVDVRQNVAAQPVAPASAPPVTPATEVIEVPASTPTVTPHKTVPLSKSSRPTVRSSPEPRASLPPEPPKAESIGEIRNHIKDLVTPFFAAISER
jgi:hypothetical protein